MDRAINDKFKLLACLVHTFPAPGCDSCWSRMIDHIRWTWEKEKAANEEGLKRLVNEVGDGKEA